MERLVYLIEIHKVCPKQALWYFKSGLHFEWIIETQVRYLNCFKTSVVLKYLLSRLIRKGKSPLN